MTKLVSILVPTKNRQYFAENILRNFYRQDYPKNKMELPTCKLHTCRYTNNICVFCLEFT